MKIAIVGQVSSVQRLPTTYQKEKDAEVTVFDHGSASHQGSSRDYQPLVFQAS